VTASAQNFKRVPINVQEGAPSPLGNYSHAMKAGPFLYVSGQGCRDAGTGTECGITLDAVGKVVAYDIEAQTHGCIKNLQTVLAAAGCTLGDLIDMTVFLTDMNDFAKYNKVYSEYFSFAGAPARTTVAVAGLPGKNYIEIMAIALCP
jgi:2-aminomuconate deaminase